MTMFTDPTEEASGIANKSLVAIHEIGGLNASVFGSDDGILEAAVALTVAEIIQEAIDKAVGNKDEARVPMP